MFHDFHQTRHEPALIGRQDTPQHVKGRDLSSNDSYVLLVRHMSKFKGGHGSKPAHLGASNQSNPNRTSDLYLAPREMEVLEWAAHGKTAWETGQLLGLTEATVRFYIRRACDRLGVKSKTHAVAICISTGVFTI